MSNTVTFGPTQSEYAVGILIKNSALSASQMESAYLNYLEKRGLDKSQFLGISLDYTPSNKAPMKAVVEPCIQRVLKLARHLKIKTLYVCDAIYFKKLAGQRKAEPCIGYSYSCAIEGYEGIKIMYGINYNAVLHNPDNQDKIDQSLLALKKYLGGILVKLGSNIVRHEEYPQGLLEIKYFFDKLHTHPLLHMDIETYSLIVNQAYIATIGASWNKHEGGAFCVDLTEVCVDPAEANPDHHIPKVNKAVRKLLRSFLETYEGKIVWHNSNFDMKILVWELFMESDIDYAGMNHGIEVVCRTCEDSKIVAYLALNACNAESSRYGLKVLAQPFAGDYAESDIKNIKKIPVRKLLRYNLVDCLSTAWVYETYYPRMVEDAQETIYKEQFKPSIKMVLRTELVGMPISLKRVKEVETILRKEWALLKFELLSNPYVLRFHEQMREALAQDYNNTHVRARRSPADFLTYQINYNSGDQIGDLLHESIGLPVIETTPTGKPSTSGDTLSKLRNHTKDAGVKDVIDKLRGLVDISKILNTFIKAFAKYSIRKSDGCHYLYGNFNLGGTVSGRLSSSRPNLTNMPSGSKYGKLVKSCFMSNKHWIFCGADFNALEARVDALWTGDRNKLSIYQGGYDSHSYNTYTYWPQKFPELTEELSDLPEDAHTERAKVINRIEDEWKDERRESKGVTFALQFQGTYLTLMTNNGFSFDESTSIVTNYDHKYVESKQATEKRIVQAMEDGYVTVAFGLRVRTPLLAKSIEGAKMIKLAEAEKRTAANAMSQSYGMLNNRAMCAILDRSKEIGLSEQILPSCLIHDCCYFLVERKVSTLETLNRLVSEEMSWTPPELYHPDVGLSAELDVFWPSWAEPTTIKAGATEEDILNLF